MPAELVGTSWAGCCRLSLRLAAAAAAAIDRSWQVMDEVVCIRDERDPAGIPKVFVLAVQASSGQKSSMRGNRTTM